MSNTAITLTLPDTLYAQVNQIAKASGQPVESVILATLTMLTSQPLTLSTDTAFLSNYTDTQLWGVIYRHLPEYINRRWQDLLAMRDQRPLTDTEQTELDRVVEMIDLYVLHRSQALVLLKQRGYDIDVYLHVDKEA